MLTGDQSMQRVGGCLERGGCLEKVASALKHKRAERVGKTELGGLCRSWSRPGPDIGEAGGQGGGRPRSPSVLAIRPR